ncbi:riboflavin synthase [Psychromicrobium silvestre]|uniref:Riboflavin synthase n=1 Tax=Psychromicrobium silvestre TaxID=1645614 RepID=A0A7Y9LR76_9MICC|nr:riboflavin synthase [Psychromicrobium silvestre]NYE94103.1 riboflavin synthase [Psychromicrobium silvestre]
MFTGIIAGRGTVRELENTTDDAARLLLEVGELADDLGLGGSIAVDGVCLTATSIDSGLLSVDVMGETLVRSTIGTLKAGDLVNLERCVAAGERFDGHVVQGHVDGVGKLLEREDLGDWQRLRFSVPEPLARYLAEKGSIAVDGVSLTVTAVSPADTSEESGHWFEVGLIPTTLEHTGLGAKQLGAGVNLEADVLAKYTERLLAFGGASAGPGRR